MKLNLRPGTLIEVETTTMGTEVVAKRRLEVVRLVSKNPRLGRRCHVVLKDQNSGLEETIDGTSIYGGEMVRIESNHRANLLGTKRDYRRIITDDTLS